MSAVMTTRATQRVTKVRTRNSECAESREKGVAIDDFGLG